MKTHQISICIDCKNFYKCIVHQTFFIDNDTKKIYFCPIKGLRFKVTGTGLCVTECVQFQAESMTYTQIAKHWGISYYKFMKEKQKYLKKTKKLGVRIICPNGRVI